MSNHQEYHKSLHPFDLPCSCGSGEVYGVCCGSQKPCPCGSGKVAIECCFSPQEEG